MNTPRDDRDLNRLQFEIREALQRLLDAVAPGVGVVGGERGCLRPAPVPDPVDHHGALLVQPGARDPGGGILQKRAPPDRGEEQRHSQLESQAPRHQSVLQIIPAVHDQANALSAFADDRGRR